MKIDKSKVKRMLFITLSNIGDIVLTTPVMSVLCGHFPSARLDVMVGPNGEDLFKKHPAVFKLIIYNKHTSLKEKRRLIQKLRKVRYDLIVDMRNSLFPFLLGAKYRTSPIQNVPRAVRHKKEQHLAKLSSIGLEVKDAPFFIHIPTEDIDFIDKIIKKSDSKKPVVAIAPGAKSEIKRWTKKGYAELVGRLIDEIDADVILAGDKADRRAVKDIIAAANKEVTDLTGETSLCQLAALLKKSDLLITNDSAPMHLGVAAGTKVLAIFGPTDPRLYGPRGKDDRVIRKKIHCVPCEKAQCEFEHECMKEITAEEVFEVAKEMLGK
ncbi:MAG: glycosyltransferase family 9 protein [Candidatus Omnitrophica bacterium]|nr:glycosyltransferase family 9 protein [Candidatus Omnitrophota bacterium]MBU4487844.1 glycosyltransferase family 9 protein [Candidatus Omnitrophota bacterium]MCG2704627.1 glycosyltransferase family 9 protein [Candidatus Omnitrophota bacterium]